MRTPYLIQRIDMRHKPPRPGKKGIDASFGFDYMGSSEFEWGALPKALKALRACPEIIEAKIVVCRLGGGGEGDLVAYYVGPKDGLEAAKAVFQDQVGDRNLHFQDPTYIDHSYDPKEKYCKAIGWWAVDEGLPNWALFKEEDDAKEWKRLVLNKEG